MTKQKIDTLFRNDIWLIFTLFIHYNLIFNRYPTFHFAFSIPFFIAYGIVFLLFAFVAFRSYRNISAKNRSKNFLQFSYGTAFFMMLNTFLVYWD